MGYFGRILRGNWLNLLVPPWRPLVQDNLQSEQDNHDVRTGRWLAWLFGWAWALAGLVLGALIAPSLAQWAGLSDTQYQDWLVIGVAVLAGFAVQLLGWVLVIPGVLVLESVTKERDGYKWPVAAGAALWVICVLPLAGVGYAIYRYLTWVGAGQRTVTVAFVGALLVKTFLIPAIKAIFLGPVLIAFKRWLQGDKAKPS